MLNLFVDRGLGDLAFLDIDNQTEFVPLAANHDSVSIAVRLWTWNDRVDHARRKIPNSLEKIAYLLVFDRQLNRIVQMLVLTTSAITKITTERIHSVR